MKSLETLKLPILGTHYNQNNNHTVKYVNNRAILHRDREQTAY